MMPLMHMPAEIMAAELRKGGEAHKILDIAASHGIFGISAAKQNPAAHIYAADWKNVLEVARKNAQGLTQEKATPLRPPAGGSPWSRWTVPHRSLANVGR
jgi:methylase of polypeptide subunit release factors